MVMKILNSCYIPMDSIEGIEKYRGKRELEKFIKNRNKTYKELFITSIVPYGLDKISVKFETVGETQKRNTIISMKELPPELQKNIIIKKQHEF